MQETIYRTPHDISKSGQEHLSISSIKEQFFDDFMKQVQVYKELFYLLAVGYMALELQQRKKNLSPNLVLFLTSSPVIGLNYVQVICLGFSLIDNGLQWWFAHSPWRSLNVTSGIYRILNSIFWFYF